ncbi:hypothetical protein EJ04DRAFT_521159 [Polyplosphaeria fusca]|uniref:Uncharacterized protein n=1 Tax=Polyplosphaeria fusca TaxID=682080 RepID=A0A9P4R5Y2_9PLEO|nr:hypothetical protein EJ04DRAFT_521159 [Polyplosphaeria fusca]
MSADAPENTKRAGIVSSATAPTQRHYCRIFHCKAVHSLRGSSSSVDATIVDLARPPFTAAMLAQVLPITSETNGLNGQEDTYSENRCSKSASDYLLQSALMPNYTTRGEGCPSEEFRSVSATCESTSHFPGSWVRGRRKRPEIDEDCERSCAV